VITIDNTTKTPARVNIVVQKDTREAVAAVRDDMRKVVGNRVTFDECLLALVQQYEDRVK